MLVECERSSSSCCYGRSSTQTTACSLNFPRPTPSGSKRARWRLQLHTLSLVSLVYVCWPSWSLHSFRTQTIMVLDYTVNRYFFSFIHMVACKCIKKVGCLTELAILIILFCLKQVVLTCVGVEKKISTGHIFKDQSSPKVSLLYRLIGTMVAFSEPNLMKLLIRT